MSKREGASAVHYGVLPDAPTGPIAVWVTVNGVRRVGDVPMDMLDKGHSQVSTNATLASASDCRFGMSRTPIDPATTSIGGWEELAWASPSTSNR